LNRLPNQSVTQGINKSGRKRSPLTGMVCQGKDRKNIRRETGTIHHIGCRGEWILLTAAEIITDLLRKRIITYTKADSLLSL